MLDANPDPAPSPAPVPSYSKAVRLELHKRMQNQELLPESGLNSKVLEAFADSDSEEEEEERPRGRGAEVGPPCDMNYFSSPVTSNSGYRAHHHMAEAFNAGLQANKK